MAYLDRRDARLQENVAIANDNARLAILKQGEMVSCLAQLSYVLGQGVQAARNTNSVPSPSMRPPLEEHWQHVPEPVQRQSVTENDDNINECPTEVGLRSSTEQHK